MRWVTSFIFVLIGTSFGVQAQTTVNLPVPPNSWTYPVDINNSGLAIGNSYDRTPPYRVQGVKWENGQISILPLRGTISFATALNDSGIIVGGGDNGANGITVPLIWRNGGVNELPHLGQGGVARDINSVGDIVGQVESESGTVPALWRNGQLIVLQSLNGSGGIATTIDENGLISGITYGGAGGQLPTQWSGNVPSALPVSFGSSFVGELGALGVNKSGNGVTSGYVVESRLLPDGNYWNVLFAVSWDANGYRVLPPVADSERSVAYDVNKNGVIAGFSENSATGDVPVLWTAQGIFRLPYDETRAAQAVGLNETGLVIGYDRTDPLNPTPVIWNVGETFNIQMANNIVAAGSTVTLTASIPRSSASFANRTVTFFANGVRIGSANTDGLGIAPLKYTVPRNASKPVRIATTLDDKSFTNRFLEIKRSSTMNGVSASYNKSTGTLSLRTTLRTRLSNMPMSGKVVTFNLNGREVARTTTDNRGTAIAIIKLPMSSGRHSIESKFAGDTTTLAISARSNFEIAR